MATPFGVRLELKYSKGVAAPTRAHFEGIA
jgi:hypothetical protein